MKIADLIAATGLEWRLNRLRRGWEIAAFIVDRQAVVVVTPYRRGRQVLVVVDREHCAAQCAIVPSVIADTISVLPR